MNITLFGHSISLHVLILICILYLIIVVNALSGPCNREGLTTQEEKDKTEYAELNANYDATQKSALSDTQKSMLDQIKQTISTMPDDKLRLAIDQTLSSLDSIELRLDEYKTKTTNPDLLSKIEASRCHPVAAPMALYNPFSKPVEPTVVDVKILHDLTSTNIPNSRVWLLSILDLLKESTKDPQIISKIEAAKCVPVAAPTSLFNPFGPAPATSPGSASSYMYNPFGQAPAGPTGGCPPCMYNSFSTSGVTGAASPMYNSFSTSGVTGAASPMYNPFSSSPAGVTGAASTMYNPFSTSGVTGAASPMYNSFSTSGVTGAASPMYNPFSAGVTGAASPMYNPFSAGVTGAASPMYNPFSTSGVTGAASPMYNPFASVGPTGASTSYFYNPFATAAPGAKTSYF